MTFSYIISSTALLPQYPPTRDDMSVTVYICMYLFVRVFKFVFIFMENKQSDLYETLHHHHFNRKRFMPGHRLPPQIANTLCLQLFSSSGFPLPSPGRYWLCQPSLCAKIIINIPYPAVIMTATVTKNSYEMNVLKCSCRFFFIYNLLWIIISEIKNYFYDRRADDFCLYLVAIIAKHG